MDVSPISWVLGANQTLSGFGAINGAVQANGTVSPGASIGTLTFSNNLTLAGTNIMEVSSGPTSDAITVSSTVAR